MTGTSGYNSGVSLVARDAASGAAGTCGALVLPVVHPVPPGGAAAPPVPVPLRGAPSWTSGVFACLPAPPRCRLCQHTGIIPGLPGEPGANGDNIHVHLISVVPGHWVRHRPRQRRRRSRRSGGRALFPASSLALCRSSLGCRCILLVGYR